MIWQSLWIQVDLDHRYHKFLHNEKHWIMRIIHKMSDCEHCLATAYSIIVGFDCKDFVVC